MIRLAPPLEQPLAHDLEVELLRLVIGYRNRGASLECTAQSLQAAFYRVCAAECGGDPDSTRKLCADFMDAGVCEYVIACQKESAALHSIQESQNATHH